jgi:glycosyltransferase involved in cell wall biosynthesis
MDKDTRMRILYLVFNQTGKGTYWRAYQFGRHLVELGHQVTLVAMSPTARLRLRETDLEGVQLVEMPDLLPGALRSGWDPWEITRRILWLREKSFDLVHGFETRPTVIYPALFATRRMGIPLFLDWADWFGTGGSLEERINPVQRALLRPVETYFENHFRQHAHGTTVINTFLHQRAIQFGVNPGSLHLLRNGSDPTIQPLDQLIARSLFGLPPDTPIIGFVGGTYQQDAQLMADAWRRVKAEHKEARLLLVGRFNRPIERLANGVPGITRTGQVSYQDVYRALSACDLCWLPLTDTGANRGRLPYKLNDYMTVGKPVVATEVGDLPAIISEHTCGVTSPPDPGSFAEATIQLLRDDEKRKIFGANARGAAENKLSWSALTRQLADFYDQQRA